MYPRLIKRVRAVLIDSVITPVLLITSIVIAGSMAIESDLIRNLISFIPALSLEPILVAFTGGTIGHHLVGIKVRCVDEDKNISIFQAIIRFVLKVFLGLASLIMIFVTKRHQAIHDALSQSIVVHKSIEGLPASELIEERIVEEEGYLYPSVLRRVLVILGYGMLLYITLSVAVFGILSSECIQNGLCSKSENTMASVSSYIFLGILVGVVVVGWKSKLYGCRKKKESTPEQKS